MQKYADQHGKHKNLKWAHGCIGPQVIEPGPTAVSDSPLEGQAGIMWGTLLGQQIKWAFVRERERERERETERER